MATNKDYCDFATCVVLKELGYNYPLELITDYFGVLDIPFHDQKIHLYDAQKWLREDKKIEVNATYDNIIELHWHWYMKSLTNRNQDTSIINYDSYEQALLAGIKETIEILKEENND